MKNLKKVLALGLALIMLLGMFTVVSAAETKMVATDLTDWDSVSHKDAVTLMVDLGIINGIANGDGTFAFKPTDNIDRASWAKMVYYAATGSDDAEAFKGTNTGLNDIADSWAVGYISFLKANQYISGDGQGNYFPTSNITVAAANKMMLTVLGYDANDKGYQNVGDMWSANVMNDAKRFGLMDEVDRQQTALMPLTRENAAQIIYNAMKANTVTAIAQWDQGVRHIERYDVDSSLGYQVFGIVPVEVHVASIDANGYATIDNVVAPVDANGNSSIKVANVTGKIKAANSVAGDNAIVFVEVTGASYDSKGNLSPSGMKVNKVISSSVSKGTSAADVTFTQGFKWTDLTNSAKTNYVAAKFKGATGTDTTQATGLGSVDIYINGQKQTTATAAMAVIQSVTWDTNDEEIPGAVVEFYLDDNNEIATIRAYIYSVGQLTGDMETRTSSAGVAQVRLPGVTGLTTWKDAENVTGYQGLKKGDVVLFYAGPNNTYVVEKAEKVTGVVTGVNSSKQITVNGVKYKRTAMDNAAAWSTGVNTEVANFANWINKEDEFAFYLDKTGAVCFTEQVTETVSKANIALVMAAEWNGTSMSVANGKLQAKLLFIDGTQQIVDVAKIDGLSVVTTLSTNATTAAKQIKGAPEGTTGVITDLESDGNGGFVTETGLTANDYAIHLLADTKIDAGNMAFYNYRVVDGKYELVKVVNDPQKTDDDDWKATQTIANASISRLADFSGNKAGGYTADSKTIFLVAKGEKDEKVYYTYTGFKNIPETTGNTTKGLAVGTYETGTAAKFVYLDTVSYSDDVPDGYVFVIDKKWADDPKNVDAYLINIVDAAGEQTTLSVDESLRDAIAAESVGSVTAYLQNSGYVGHFCSVDEIDEKGVVHKLTAVTSLGTIDALGNEVVKSSADNGYAYDNVTKFVFVDLAINDGDKVDDASDDFIEFSGCGPFNPNGFYRAADVDGTKTPGQDASNTASASFASVNMVVISADQEVADYVYVVRVIW